MCDERWGAVAEASTEIEPDGGRPQTAKEATDLWRNTLRTDPTEAVRMRHCCGCQWLKSCGRSLSCSYLLDTGEKRPCPPGPNCGAKKTPPGFRYPQGYAEWCAGYDRKYGAAPRKKRREDFTLAYARQLYDRKYSSADIAEIVGMDVIKLRGYATRRNWKMGDKSRVKSRASDLSEEKAAFQRAKSEWEKINGIADENEE